MLLARTFPGRYKSLRAHYSHAYERPRIFFFLGLDDVIADLSTFLRPGSTRK